LTPPLTSGFAGPEQEIFPMKQMLAALAALTLAAAPAAAAPQPIEPASESAEGSGLRGGVYWVLPVLIVIALLIAILAGGDDEAEPLSP
jgi:hypothetical protein